MLMFLAHNDIQPTVGYECFLKADWIDFYHEEIERITPYASGYSGTPVVIFYFVYADHTGSHFIMATYCYIFMIPLFDFQVTNLLESLPLVWNTLLHILLLNRIDGLHHKLCKFRILIGGKL